MKSKFGSFDFGSVEVLSREEEAKVKGGAYGAGPGSGAFLETYYCTCKKATITGTVFANFQVQALSCITARAACGDGCFSLGYFDTKTTYNGRVC